MGIKKIVKSMNKAVDNIRRNSPDTIKQAKEVTKLNFIEEEKMKKPPRTTDVFHMQTKRERDKFREKFFNHFPFKRKLKR